MASLGMLAIKTPESLLTGRSHMQSHESLSEQAVSYANKAGTTKVVSSSNY